MAEKDGSAKTQGYGGGCAGSGGREEGRLCRERDLSLCRASCSYNFCDRSTNGLRNQCSRDLQHSGSCPAKFASPLPFVYLNQQGLWTSGTRGGPAGDRIAS